jgi:hypothetical protein
MVIHGLPQEALAAFGEIAHRLGRDPDDLLVKMVQKVVTVDRDLKRAGLKGIGYFLGKINPDEVSAAAATAISGDIRESGFMWPSDKPFPWSDADCAAAVRGYEVRWPLSRDEFYLLRGKWEMVNGYAVLHQP